MEGHTPMITKGVLLSAMVFVVSCLVYTPLISLFLLAMIAAGLAGAWLRGREIETDSALNCVPRDVAMRALASRGQDNFRSML